MDQKCPVCSKTCGKAIGASRQTQNRFWGGSKHGAKLFYTDEATFFFCSEDCRTTFFFSGPQYDYAAHEEADSNAEVAGD